MDLWRLLRSRAGSTWSAPLRIGIEFLRGFRALHFVGPCVTVFGSARFPDGHRYYSLAREIGAGLARAGFTVMTGPSVIEAANRGVRDAGSRSIGCNIELPRSRHVLAAASTVNRAARHRRDDRPQTRRGSS